MDDNKNQESSTSSSTSRPVRPKLGPKAHSSPRLPVVSITADDDDTGNSPDRQDSLRSSQTDNSLLNIVPMRNRGRRDTYFTDHHRVIEEDETESSESENNDSDTDINEYTEKDEALAYPDDEKDNSTATLNKANSIHSENFRIPNYPAENPEAHSLVEAALIKDEARDRHIRFQDHVVESANLVQRMISQRYTPQQTNSDSLGSFMANRYESRHTEEEPELPSVQASFGSGSVLASLMKLEAHRQGTPEMPQKKEKKKLKIKRNKKPKKAKSLVDFPLSSNNDTFNENSNNGAPKRPSMAYRPVSWLSGTSRSQQRPPMVNRPASWLSEVASNKYVVPSLEKRKKSAPATSRRPSRDSMLTTASQFERITLEDRIRITFEIANILQKQEFLRKLCRALMHYGCPAHRLEYAMRQVSRTLAVDAEYVYFPSIMLITFIDSTTHTTDTHFIRQAQAFEMHRLQDIHRLEKLVAHGEVTVDEALEFIDKVASQPAIYPMWLHPFVYALAAFAGCILFFGGRWKEGGICAALSSEYLNVYFLVFATNEIFSNYIASFQPIWEITVCVVIGFVARAITKYGFCFTPIAFSSFIIVLP
ncbi:Pheromone-regulated membrane protein 10, partial [Choanephora cucurbitarum]